MLVYRGKIPFMLGDYKENIIYLCSSNRNIEDYYAVLEDIYDGTILKFESTGNDDEIEKLNYDFLKLLKSEEKYIMLVSLESFLRDYFLEGESVEFSLGKSVDLKKLEEELVKNGYARNYMVEERKQYSIRGDILDIFPADSDAPVRMELSFGDEVDRISIFDIESQRSIEKKKNFRMYMGNNKEERVSFYSLVKDLKGAKFLIENPELLKYKLEELILRDRDRENLMRSRFNEIKNMGEEIEIKQFTHEEIHYFENHEFIHDLEENPQIKVLIMSEEAKRYSDIFKGIENMEFKRYPLFEGYREENLLVLTDRELKGVRVRRESSDKVSLKYKNLSEIREGDYIIHENYGVGLYLGIEIIDGHEYLKIKYADEDKLFVPVEGISRIEKYVSPPGVVPEIYNLGRRGFKRKKEKLYEEMLLFAKEIIEVQARRQSGLGYRFSPDTIWQEEFEEGFPYNETQSQRQAIQDVKFDMESSRVMDRVVCGDVGYGKTEVAMRAAFKAAIDGKQVAILVPTTVLAQQHFARFSERMKNYPITIELLSRLKTGGEQKKAIHSIEKGSIDIIIGTHRMLSKDVKFKDLGLVIIDEEQKFGVKAKEKLKKMRASVDMLTLTATPIPRTLNLSLLGIRDLSVIDTPPEGRKPIDTFFIPKESSDLKDIIMKEIAREGQVFYIYNYVNGISKKAQELAGILPEYIKIDYVHGQMQPREIRDKIKSFENGEVDILVATTIIENGIDIENANTMIIDGVEKLGLSQIYQLRGRIGRGHKQAYCYLLLKEEQGKKAKEREESLRNLEEQGGGGLQLSLEDMRIRGAGEILGERQHGALETFGYNLYMKMLQEEIERQKGEFVPQDTFEDIEVKVDFSAFIPDEYIDKNQKIKVYRELVEISSLKQLEEYREEVTDIYGKMPQEAKGLFEYIALKFRARELGIKKAIELDEGGCEIKFDRDKVEVEVILRLIQERKITYRNRQELVNYPGKIGEFLDIYEKYRGECKNEGI